MPNHLSTCSIGDAQYCLEQAKSMLERARFMWSQAHKTLERTKTMRSTLYAQIQELAKRVSFRQRFTENVLSSILDAAIQATSADMGNIQLFDPRTFQLVIHVHRGFDEPFLRYFNSVPCGQAACGTALKYGRRIVVPDITNSPFFPSADGLEVMLDAGVRSVQSTPLISKSRRIWGMLSTHYRNVNLPGRKDLYLIDYFADWAAEVLDAEFAVGSNVKTALANDGHGAGIPDLALASRA